ncbi:MAG: Ig-like domain-containing protein, partial [Bryobacteraceae bacterium]
MMNRNWPSLGAFALVNLLFSTPAYSQLNDSCTVSVLNRTVTAQPDGTWVVPNIPSNQGRIRARATCVQYGATISGQSELFVVPLDGAVDVLPIQFGTLSPIPDSVTISAPSNTTQVGATLQLATSAKYPDGKSADITAAIAGTDYTSSVPQVASVSADGLVTALDTGSTLITAFNEGTQGFFVVTVGGGVPVITITSPADGASVTQGSTLTVTVEVTRGTVSVVFLLADGQQVGTAYTSPYRFSYQIPVTAGSIVLTAQAIDASGNTETSLPITIFAVVDPGTTAVGSVVDPSGSPVSGAKVSCQGVSGVTLSDGRFSIAGVPTAQSSVVCSASFTNPSGVTLSGSSMRVTAIAKGNTDVGQITLGSLNNRGTDFWMTLENNYPSGNGAQLTILSDTVAKFTVTAPGFSKTGTASPSSPQTIALPASLQITDNQTAENRGIHLTSDAEIFATFFYTSPDGVHDAYLAIPTSSLDKEYFAASYIGGSSQFAVTAAANNTNVAITPSCKSVSGSQAGASFNVMLNQGQTYQYECDTDVTGSHIVSDQPVSVVAGNGCAFIPSGSSSCDVTTEMMFPVSKLYGTDFYAVAFLDTAIRILAAKDGTSVTADDGSTVTTYSLNAGQFKEIRTN